MSTPSLLLLGRALSSGGVLRFPKFGPSLSLVDRSTALPLLAPWLDFDGSKEAWQRYDDATAHSLFTLPGISKKFDYMTGYVFALEGSNQSNFLFLAWQAL